MASKLLPRRPLMCARRRHRQQQNLLTGTEVWTVPGRGNGCSRRAPDRVPPSTTRLTGTTVRSGSKRYLETPPEKSRLCRDDGTWEQLDALLADKLGDTVAEFRRIPNLFEIVSITTGTQIHGHMPSEADCHRMARSDAGYDHVTNVARADAGLGMSEGEFAATSARPRLQAANGFSPAA